MNAQNLALAKGLVDPSYIEQGSQELRKRETLVRILLSQRCLPEVGWDDSTIGMLLAQLSAMDSNNFVGSVGAGEREARVFSSLVRQRHFGLGHGIGRSGDIAAVQPKAAGSSLIYKLTNKLVLNAIRICGVQKTEAALVLPLATGMSLTLALVTLKSQRPSTAKYVIWPRIDQKSCFKCMITAGCEPVVIENVLEGFELRTDTDAIRRTIIELGAENIVGVLTTTSCFAPRGCDKVVDVAKLCTEYGIGHVINNAYGLQSSKICHEVNEACRLGRVDAWVSSTDKNFLVPVGGAIVAGPSSAFIDSVSRCYPGRASVSPILDLFITLLSMGQSGLKQLLAQRKDVFQRLQSRIAELASRHGEQVLLAPQNSISIAMSVDSITSPSAATVPEASVPSPTATTPPPAPSELSSGRAAASSDNALNISSASSVGSGGSGRTIGGSNRATYLGSMLFSRGVSGTRVVVSGPLPSAVQTPDAIPAAASASEVETDHSGGNHTDRALAAASATSNAASQSDSLASGAQTSPAPGPALPALKGDTRRIDKYTFHNYGSQSNVYPHCYLTAAAGIGMTVADVDVYIERLEKTIVEFKKQFNR